MCLLAERRVSCRRFPAVCGCLLLAAGACTSPRPTEQQLEAIQSHVVSFDPSGRPLNPRTDIEGWQLGDQRMIQPHYEERVRQIMASARTYLTGGPGRKVLVFVHGGLNTYSDSFARVRQQADAMRRDGYYPIFVAWDSTLVNSYFDNLLYEDGSWSWMKVAMSPFVFARDVAAGVLNIVPRTATAILAWSGAGGRTRQQTAASAAQALHAAFEPGIEARTDAANEHVDGPTAALVAEEDRAWATRNRQLPDFAELPRFQPSGLADSYRYSRWSPSRLLLPVSMATSFLIDAFGNGAWAGMIRRTKRLFDDEDIGNIGRQQGHAGLSLLMRELRDLQCSLRVKDGRLHRDRAQQGFEILRLGLRRLLDKIRAPATSGRSGGWWSWSSRSGWPGTACGGRRCSWA